MNSFLLGRPAEDQLLVMLSRLHISKDMEENITAMINKGFDIERLFSLAVRHKVHPLVGYNLNRLDLSSRVKLQYKFLFTYAYQGNKLRNETQMKELDQLLSLFQKHSLDIVPLKGAILAPQIYKDIGLRTLNDLDFLVSMEDKDKIKVIMEETGFSVGKFNWKNQSVIQPDRKTFMVWQMHVGNLYPFIKVSNSDFAQYVKVDFSYDVDLQKNYTSSRKLLDNKTQFELMGKRIYALEMHDFLIHLSIHLFKEATNVQWIIMHQDLNLIKFCDIREYILANKHLLEWSYLAERSKELQAAEALYYSLYYLHAIYGEDYLSPIESILSVSNTSFLEDYGRNDYGVDCKWDSDFMERFFSLYSDNPVYENTKTTRLGKL